MRMKEVIKEDEVGRMEDVLPEFKVIQEHHKLTMQKLVELKDKKVWDSIYIKCHLCGQFKPAKEGNLLTSHPTTNCERLGKGKYELQITVKEICEVVCNDCLEHFPSGYRCSLKINCDDCKERPCEIPDVIR